MNLRTRLLLMWPHHYARKSAAGHTVPDTRSSKAPRALVPSSLCTNLEPSMGYLQFLDLFMPVSIDPVP